MNHPSFKSITPICRELQDIFDILSDSELLSALKAHTGRPSPVAILWKTYVASFVLHIPSFAALIRTLQDNPYLAQTCGIDCLKNIPSKYAYSRFIKKLARPRNIGRVKNILRNLTRRFYANLPDFGKSVAIDSTDIKAWSNIAKKPASDPDATWTVKSSSGKLRKYYLGYKVHALVDTKYELPIAINITTANVTDVKEATRVLYHARYITDKFNPEQIICDAGYSSDKLRKHIRCQYRALPIIKVNKAHKKALFKETPEWKRKYNLRGAIERFFSRLKCHRKLNYLTLQGIRKVTVHCFLSVIILQVYSLHAILSQAPIRNSVRAVS